MVGRAVVILRGEERPEICKYQPAVQVRLSGIFNRELDYKLQAVVNHTYFFTMDY